MNRRKAPLFVALVLLLAGSAVLISRTRSAEAPPPQAQSAESRRLSNLRYPIAMAPEPGQNSVYPPPPPESEARPVGNTPGDMVSYLRSRYGARISDPHTQMRMLEELMRYFQRLNPTGWEADLLALVKRTFPELYDELALRLRQRVDYERWMKEHQAELQEKPAAERRAAVWEERHKLFGKDVAEKIWAGELRNQAVADALASIDALPDASLGDRMSKYKESLAKTYGKDTEAYVKAHQHEMLNHFLDLGSVQKQLSALPPAERSENLRTIRKEMGLDDEALQRWDELDKVRDTRWEVGSQYMSEREALAQQYSGAELEQKLQPLRARYFPDEADTIAEEEQSGFYRFTRPRQWGRN